MTISIVTDSVACIPENMLLKYNIHVAPVHIIWDRVQYRDGVDLKASEFYARLRKSKTLPTTSSAMQGEFMQIYEEVRPKVDGIVVLPLSGGFGAALGTANMAREAMSDFPIEVIDTRTVMMAQGFIVLEAAKVAAGRGSIEEVVKAARDAMSSVHVFWAMDTLEYMRRGGRISLPKALLASWMRVKPIVGIKEGIIEPLTKANSRPKAIDKLLEIMEQRVDSTRKLHVAVIHGDVPEEAKRLAERIAARFKCMEIITSEITPVIGTHIGPGALGLCLYNE